MQRADATQSVVARAGAELALAEALAGTVGGHAEGVRAALAARCGRAADFGGGFGAFAWRHVAFAAGRAVVCGQAGGRGVGASPRLDVAEGEQRRRQVAAADAGPARRRGGWGDCGCLRVERLDDQVVDLAVAVEILPLLALEREEAHGVLEDDERKLGVADLDWAGRHGLSGVVQDVELDVVDEHHLVPTIAVAVEVAVGMIELTVRLRQLLAGEGEQSTAEHEIGRRQRSPATGLGKCGSRRSRSAR